MLFPESFEAPISMCHPAVRVSLAIALAFAAAPPGVARAQAPELSADQSAALGRVSADSLRGHLSFLASDLLEGRDTPSRGLDLAAEYIAAQFRRAGLEPVGDDGYFQNANWKVSEPDPDSFSLELRAGGETINVRKERITLGRSGKLEIGPTAIVKLDAKDLAGLKREQVEGKAVAIAVPDPNRADRSGRMVAIRDRQVILERLGTLKAALILAPDRDPEGGMGLGAGQLIDPENPRRGAGPQGNLPGPPIVRIHDPKAVKMLDNLPQDATVVLKVGATVERPVKLRNVIGLLRGSDPVLKETYVLVTAHYDHIGVGSPVNGDRVFNGANDDGSGTVSVVEIASALASLKERPKRSLVFMTFFGEEKGLLGSRYYGRHPIYPVEKTVADVNLEQVGRTDSTEGSQVGKASMTGMDFSDVGTIFQTAGEAEGVKVYKHPQNSDAFFGRSDNQALADLGVPAHTLCVAFIYADYHGIADHWDKVDYANMAKVDRTVGRALLMIANNPDEPKWNAANPKASRYLKAYQDRRAK
jgi:hypothetical protein